MNALVINPNKTVGFTGHRIIEKDFDVNKVEKVVKDLIKNGYDTFLVGMAIGFDTECFKIIYKLKKEYSIKIIACIPCVNQSARFNSKQKQEYGSLLEKADDKIIFSEEYDATCMKKRNRFLVDYSSIMVAYLRHNRSGTSSTVNYAIKKGIKIIFI